MCSVGRVGVSEHSVCSQESDRLLEPIAFALGPVLLQKALYKGVQLTT